MPVCALIDRGGLTLSGLHNWKKPFLFLCWKWAVNLDLGHREKSEHTQQWESQPSLSCQQEQMVIGLHAWTSPLLVRTMQQIETWEVLNEEERVERQVHRWRDSKIPRRRKLNV